MDEMMQSNRVIINDKRSAIPVRMFIGRRVIRRNQRMSKRVPAKNEYGVVLEGITHNYYFSMKSGRAKEMIQRMNNGQQFH